MAGYTRQKESEIQSGLVVKHSSLNSEFNKILDAFHNVTGHSHDGTAAEGGPITVVTDADGDTKIQVEESSDEDIIRFDIGGTEQVVIADGSIKPTTNNDIDLGTASLEYKDLFLNGTAHIDTLDVDENATVAGTLGVTGAFTGSSTVQGTTITATTAFAPDTSDGAALGTSSLQFSDLFLADGGIINLGDDQDVTITHVADTGVLLNSTKQLQFGDSGTYIHQSADGVLDLVSDNEIEINGTTIDINGAVDMSSTLGVTGKITADGGIDIDDFNIDGTTIALSSGDMTIDVAGDINLDADGADIVLKDDGTQYGAFTNSSSNLVIKSGSTTSATFDGANVTFAGTVSPTSHLDMPDSAIIKLGTGDDLQIQHDGTDSLISNSTGTLKIATETSGVPVTIGHTTSEVTVADNLTVTGNLTVQGTQTVVDTVTMNAANAIVFEGATADAHETTLTIVDPTADRTINLPNQSGTLPVLAASSNTAISATPAELNIMDGDTSATGTTIVDADRVVLNDNGTMVQVAVTDLAAYFDDEITAMPNLVTTAATTVGALDSGSITSGFGAINNGSSAITTTGTVTFGSLSDGTVTITDIADEDDMASNSATKLVTQQSIKAYVDANKNVEGVSATGAEINTTSDGDTSVGTTAVAGGDGIVTNDNGTMRQTSVDTFDTYFAGTTKTLTNKTLTAPKFADGGFIADANGAEALVFQTVSSAVNALEVTNAATSGAVVIGAMGDDSNVDIDITPKGTGEVNIAAGNLNYAGTAITATGAELNLLDGDTARGTTAVADGDGILINDNGTMRMTSVQTVKTYMTGSTLNSTSERGSFTVGTSAGTYTGSTTVFPATYDVGFVDVYLNGVKLAPADFTATNGTTITLGSAASSGDSLQTVAYSTFDSANHYTKTSSDARYAQLSNNLSDVTASTARTNLGLGTMATQASSNVTITGGSLSNLTALEVEGGLIELKSNSGAVAKIDLYCESSNAHKVTLQPPAHANYTGNVVSTLPNTTGTLVNEGKAIAMALIFG